VWDSYDAWQGAERADAALAFQAYVAALDREERASVVYAGLMSRLDQLVTTHSDRRGMGHSASGPN
jgi:hypothetical protein